MFHQLFTGLVRIHSLNRQWQEERHLAARLRGIRAPTAQTLSLAPSRSLQAAMSYYQEHRAIMAAMKQRAKESQSKRERKCDAGGAKPRHFAPPPAGNMEGVPRAPVAGLS